MATEFQKTVWDVLKKIPRGKVTTYGEIADYLGKPKAARAVGSAVAKNPNVPVVPCHRVVPSNGKIGNYSGDSGPEGKISLLKSENVQIREGKVVNFPEVFWRFR